MHQCAGSGARAHKIDQKIEHLRVQDRRRFEVLARGSSPSEHKDSRADDGPDAKRGQRPRPECLSELMLWAFGIGYQLVDGLAGEQLMVGQCSAPWDACSYVAGGASPAPTQVAYLFAVPRASFFTLLFFDPRAYSRGLSGFSVARFLRAARLDFLRSSLLSFLVLAMNAWESLYF